MCVLCVNDAARQMCGQATCDWRAKINLICVTVYRNVETKNRLSCAGVKAKDASGPSNDGQGKDVRSEQCTAEPENVSSWARVASVKDAAHRGRAGGETYPIRGNMTGVKTRSRP
ncbi:hypothetical protein AVEN_473-1 [Araneus ventricosus]|uniref:Uncharacterized protein n=1 Tax=Araneus ventricosus TaxID=182803 RepID=A0A4Y2UIS2_ARAVE|nr:hypothetical protein AVEN_473-1 [Araneus ventricosus]